jgi:hypothetical protein
VNWGHEANSNTVTSNPWLATLGNRIAITIAVPIAI